MANAEMDGNQSRIQTYQTFQSMIIHKIIKRLKYFDFFSAPKTNAIGSSDLNDLDENVILIKKLTIAVKDNK